jgi:Arc/MetJ-type ribon-helix-helix transcriptional regulator
MANTITVRLSDRERKELQRHGKVSEVVREALRLYLRTRNSKRIIARLKELQNVPLRTTIQEDLRLIRSDRER